MHRFTRLAAAAALAALVPTVAAAPAIACGDKTAAPAKAVPADAAKVVIVVEGMHCDGCATTVRNAVVAVGGVYDAQVDVSSGLATVQYDAKATTPAAIAAAIDKSGYKAGKATPAS